jgi:serine/threonine-protein kinase
MSDTLPRLREWLKRSRSGDPSARRELEEGLRRLSSGEYAEVLARWEEARSRGASLSAEELCRGRPESAPTVVEVIRLVEDAHACLTITGITQGPDGRPAPAPRMPEVPGYELLEVLGRGGMGVVYKARQLGFNRVVALKMIRAGDGSTTDSGRFRVEAEAVARLRHPNIVQVYDTGEADGSPYFSMEYLEGGALADRVRDEPLPPRRAAELVEALARAMQHAHAQGVIHRDLKPSNVLLGADGTPKVADFGLARLLDAEATRTASEVVLGTACYMAPEQAAGRSRDIGPATDIYGLGAILYCLLTGRPPFERGSWVTVLERVRTEEPTQPRRLRPDVDRDLEAVCLKCLEKEPARRYAGAGALADDLRRYLSAEPTQVRPPGRAGRAWRSARRHPWLCAAAVLLLLVAAAGPVAAYFLDPMRVPKDNAAALRRGRAVTLVPDRGPPRWSRWVLGEEVPAPSPFHDGAFTISTTRLRLLELMPEMPAAGYRLSAEVRHDRRVTLDQVGLYFAFDTHRHDGQEEQTFCALTFNDRAAADGTDRGGGVLKLSGWRYNVTTDRLDEGRVLCRHTFRPAVAEAPPRHPWRRIVFEVRPDRVEVSWADDAGGELAPVGAVTFDAITQAYSFQSDMLEPAHVPRLVPQPSPRLAVGLFLYPGVVSYRNVVVEPL